jgi:hypothetical protein
MSEIAGRRWKNHWTYYLDGLKLPGPSTLARMVPSDLTNWYAEQAAELAVNNWERLSGLPLLARLKEIKGAANATRDKAAAAGTLRHQVMDRLVNGLPVDPNEPELVADPQAVPDAEAAARLLDAFEIQPAHAEIPLANLEQLYAGTADLIAHSPALGGDVLLDHKFGKHVYPSHAIQLAAYAHSTHMIEVAKTEHTGPRGGKKPPTFEFALAPAPDVRQDVAYILHTHGGSAEMLPVKIDGWVWDAVLIACDTYWEWETRTGWNFREKDSFDSPIGPPLNPPGPDPADPADDPPF